MPQQLSFVTLTAEDAWSEWLDSIRDIVRYHGHKEVAPRLDISVSELSNALAERNRCELKARHLPHLLAMRPDDNLPGLIAKHCGLELSQPRELTPEQRLARLEEALLRSGPAGQAILADAYSPGRRR